MGTDAAQFAASAAAAAAAALLQGSGPSPASVLAPLLPGAVHASLTLACQGHEAALHSGNLLAAVPEQASLLGGPSPSLAGVVIKERKAKLMKHG